MTFRRMSHSNLSCHQKILVPEIFVSKSFNNKNEVFPQNSVAWGLQGCFTTAYCGCREPQVTPETQSTWLINCVVTVPFHSDWKMFMRRQPVLRALTFWVFCWEMWTKVGMKGTAKVTVIKERLNRLQPWKPRARDRQSETCLASP